MGPTVPQEISNVVLFFIYCQKKQQLSYSFTFVSKVNFPNLPHCCDKCFQSVSDAQCLCQPSPTRLADPSQAHPMFRQLAADTLSTY